MVQKSEYFDKVEAIVGKTKEVYRLLSKKYNEVTLSSKQVISYKIFNREHVIAYITDKEILVGNPAEKLFSVAKVILRSEPSFIPNIGEVAVVIGEMNSCIPEGIMFNNLDSAAEAIKKFDIDFVSDDVYIDSNIINSTDNNNEIEPDQCDDGETQKRWSRY